MDFWQIIKTTEEKQSFKRDTQSKTNKKQILTEFNILASHSGIDEFGSLTTYNKEVDVISKKIITYV